MVSSEHKSTLLQKIVNSEYLRRDAVPTKAWDIVIWWEFRRIPFNLTIGIFGLITCFVCIASLVPLSLIDEDVALLPDPPIFAIFGVILYAVLANICYTGGWVVEIMLYMLGRRGDRLFGPICLVLGTTFSILLTLLPALFCAAYTVVMILGSAR